MNEYYHIIATAYNSVPAGIDHCIDVPCAGTRFPSGQGLEHCIAQHAETLALIRCPNIREIHTCYVTTSPCIGCTRRLLDTSCKRVVYSEQYAHKESSGLWLSRGREWIQV